MYGRLFGWIVNKVNQLLAPPLASRGEEVTEIGKSETGWFEITSLLIWNTFYVCCCLRTSGSSVLSCWLIKIAIWQCHEFKAREITTANRIKWRKSEETKANSKQIQAVNGVTDQVKNNSSDDFEVSFQFCTWSVHKRMVGVFWTKHRAKSI